EVYYDQYDAQSRRRSRHRGVRYDPNARTNFHYDRVAPDAGDQPHDEANCRGRAALRRDPGQPGSWLSRRPENALVPCLPRGDGRSGRARWARLGGMHAPAVLVIRKKARSTNALLKSTLIARA